MGKLQIHRRTSARFILERTSRAPDDAASDAVSSRSKESPLELPSDDMAVSSHHVG
jgi:hypothetical protein